MNQSDVDGLPSISATIGHENVETSLGGLLSNRKKLGLGKSGIRELNADLK